MKIENLEHLRFVDAVNKIADRILNDNYFIQVDMAIECPTEATDEPIEDVYHNSCSWFGMKRVDSPFDSSDKLYMVDLYGGGAATIVQVHKEEDSDSIIHDLRLSFANCFESCGYGIDDNEYVLIEWMN